MTQIKRKLAKDKSSDASTDDGRLIVRRYSYAVWKSLHVRSPLNQESRRSRY